MGNRPIADNRDPKVPQPRESLVLCQHPPRDALHFQILARPQLMTRQLSRLDGNRSELGRRRCPVEQPNSPIELVPARQPVLRQLLTPGELRSGNLFRHPSQIPISSSGTTLCAVPVATFLSPAVTANRDWTMPVPGETKVTSRT